MEKGFRTFDCPADDCGMRMRFPVTPAHYGTVMKVRCKNCRTVHDIRIPTPPTPERTSSEKGKFDDFFDDIFKNKGSKR